LHNFIYSTENGYEIHSAGELKIWKSRECKFDDHLTK